MNLADSQSKHTEPKINGKNQWDGDYWYEAVDCMRQQPLAKSAKYANFPIANYTETNTRAYFNPHFFPS